MMRVVLTYIVVVCESNEGQRVKYNVYTTQYLHCLHINTYNTHCDTCRRTDMHTHTTHWKIHTQKHIHTVYEVYLAVILIWQFGDFSSVRQI